MFAGQRTWKVYAGNDFLGYEYAVEHGEAVDKTIKKFGVPQTWDVDEYTIEKIKWIEEDLE